MTDHPTPASPDPRERGEFNADDATLVVRYGAAPRCESHVGVPFTKVKREHCVNCLAIAIKAAHRAPAREVREVRIGEEDDEIVTHGVIHVERMSDRHIWANLGGVSFDFVVVKGKLVWRVQDMEWADLPRAYAALTPDAEGGR